MRLFARRDGPLAMALLAATFILFNRPLHSLLDVAHEVEQRYQVDLLPALGLLVTAFLLHEHQKRQQNQEEARAAAAEATQMRIRLAELQRLMTFSRLLASSLGSGSVQQVTWQCLPAFAHGHEIWLVVARPDGSWEQLQQDAGAETSPSAHRQFLAAEALTKGESWDAGGFCPDDVQVLFALRAGGTPIGVMSVGNVPALSDVDRRVLGTAAGLIGIALRNTQVLQDTREHATHDGLTGCVNHAYGVELLGTELRRAHRTRQPVSVLMFDLDHFKEINDQLGHTQGDIVLAAVGARLPTVMRATDTCCRYGGDEFLVILPDTPASGAGQLAACLRHEIMVLGTDSTAPQVTITASIGIATANEGEMDPLVLITRADESLYLAKRGGRDQVYPPPAPA